MEGFDELEGCNTRPGWQPGAEPGFDPSLADGGHASMPTLNAKWEITVVDFSLEHMVKQHFDNDTFIALLQQPPPSWGQCRWINVNGLSWDVVQAIGTNKGLHKLALEDVMNIRNRTKADWYPSHAYIVMTLQKLVYLAGDGDSDSESNSLFSHTCVPAVFCSFFGLWKTEKVPQDVKKEVMRELKRQPGSETGSTNDTEIMRTLQPFHASGNEARTQYMESHSSLAPYKMAVSAEQVSIFLTSDNTVISFSKSRQVMLSAPW